jgi:putative ABC transport system permease protein
MVTRYVGPQLKEILGYSIDDFRKAGNDFSYVLEPIKDIHLKGAPQYNLEPPGSLTTVIIFGAIAILILIGLITYITTKRIREIGIRKTYGASLQTVLMLLSKEVAYLIIVSSVLAYPVAYFGSKYWLEGFATRVSMSPFVFILATLITLLIGWLSISYQTIKAANYNPAEALRSK